MTQHRDVERLLAAALAELNRRAVIQAALDALPPADRRRLEAQLAFAILRGFGA